MGGCGPPTIGTTITPIKKDRSLESPTNRSGNTKYSDPIRTEKTQRRQTRPIPNHPRRTDRENNRRNISKRSEMADFLIARAMHLVNNQHRTRMSISFIIYCQ